MCGNITFDFPAVSKVPSCAGEVVLSGTGSEGGGEGNGRMVGNQI